MYQTMISQLRAFCRSDTGATAIEYALIASGVALAIAPFMPAFRQAFVENYTTMAAAMK